MSPGATQPVTRRSILHVLAPETVGGLERVVRTLAIGQAARGHSVAVATILSESAEAAGPSPVAPHPFVADFAGTGVTVAPLVLGRFGYRRERAAIAALCGERAVEIVHTHGRRPDVVDAGIARRRGAAVVSTIHGFTFTGVGWRNWAYDGLQKRAHRRFDALIGVSDQVGAALVRRGVAETRVHVIPNAYETGRPLMARATARSALGLADAAFVIGWVGRLSREKGMDVLLSALALVGDRPLVVAVLGAGRERAALEAAAAASGVAARVRWIGEVSDAARLYRAFDLFVLSSRTEGTPIALFEAMDAEVPIVATSVGGVPAVVTPAEALLVPAEDPVALARAIGAAFDDPAAGRVRAASARVRLTTSYAIGPWLDRHDGLYAALAARRAWAGGGPS